MGEVRHPYKLFVGKVKGRDILEEQGVDGQVIFE
jgi:hypothetical protein